MEDQVCTNSSTKKTLSDSTLVLRYFSASIRHAILNWSKIRKNAKILTFIQVQEAVGGLYIDLILFNRFVCFLLDSWLAEV